MKQAKPLTCEQYLKKFSRAVRWRLPPQESEEAIADYRELIFQPERDESKLVEELGDPVQATHLLTDVKAYRRWLAVFAVLAFGLFLLAKCYDRRWLALYVLALTIAAICGFIEFNLVRMNISYRGSLEIQGYLFARILPIGLVGLIGTGVALC